ncbi:helix-turn-helix domain-containing protein [Frigoribacterium sp. ME-P-080]|uniref:helix-turn-helix domain-containing protein n=1 Tax=Frigoribacterium sp. ME-P-080 TaxID=3040289 RepID=UPI00254BA12B|nr:helix-turn-helix domain-containing protein [Frigoribacterium sp. ME-P-080]
MTARHLTQPALILEGRDAAILWQIGQLEPARVKARGRDEEGYAVLLAVYQAALTWRNSVEGKAASQSEERRERSNWVTPTDLAKQLGVTPRTIRNDIAGGILPATKRDRQWVIDLPDAFTYIAARRPN